MTTQNYFFIAMRLAFSRRGPNLISAVAVTALSLLPLIAAMEVADGMTQGIVSRYLETSSYHFRATPLSYIPAEFEIEQIAQKLYQNPAVLTVSPERQNFAMAFSSFGRQGVLLRGLKPDFYVEDSGFQKYLSFSSGDAVLDDQSVLVGESLAKNLNLQTGGVLRLLTIQEEGRIPIIRSFTVKGIFSVGYHDLDKSWVLLNENQKVFFSENKASQFFLGIKVKDPFSDTEAQKQALQESLPEDWLVLDWPAMNYAMIENFRVTTLMLLFVLALIVCVAVINNKGALQIFFLSRRKEIALMMAMGAKPADIHKIFLGLGLLVGFCGAVAGSAGGLLLAFNINGIILGLEKLSNFFDALMYGRVPGNESFYLEQTQIQADIYKILLVIVFVMLWSVMVNYRAVGKISRSKVLSILRKI